MNGQKDDYNTHVHSRILFWRNACLIPINTFINVDDMLKTKAEKWSTG